MDKINRIIWELPDWVHKIIFMVTGRCLFRIRSVYPGQDGITVRFEWNDRD